MKKRAVCFALSGKRALVACLCCLMLMACKTTVKPELPEPVPFLGVALDMTPETVRQVLKQQGYIITGREVHEPFCRVAYRSTSRTAVFEEVTVLLCLRRQAVVGLYASGEDVEMIAIQANRSFGLQRAKQVDTIPPVPDLESTPVERKSRFPLHGVRAGEVRYTLFASADFTQSGISMENPQKIRQCKLLYQREQEHEKTLFQSIRQDAATFGPAAGGERLRLRREEDRRYPPIRRSVHN